MSTRLLTENLKLFFMQDSAAQSNR